MKKKWYKSKTLWTNFVSGLMAAVGIGALYLPLLEGTTPAHWYAYLLFFFSVANAILRKITKTAI